MLLVNCLEFWNLKCPLTPKLTPAPPKKTGRRTSMRTKFKVAGNLVAALLLLISEWKTRNPLADPTE